MPPVVSEQPVIAESASTLEAAATAPPLVIELPVTFDSGVDVEDGVGDDRAVSHTETHAAANGNPVACRFETPRRAGIRAVKRQASI